MALSMEEQRILAEIETHLSQDDPRLAQRLTGLAEARRRRRIHLITAVVVAVIAAVAAVAAAVVIAIS